MQTEDDQECSHKRRRIDPEEKKLEDFLFGDDAEHLPFGKEAEIAAEDEQARESELFQIDVVGTNDNGLADSKADTGARVCSNQDLKESEVAWNDEDDEQLNVNVASVPRLRKLRQREDEQLLCGKAYEERLRNKFKEIHGQPDWASLPVSHSQGNEDAEDDILRSNKQLSERVSGPLPKTLIEMTRMKDANCQEYSQAVVRVCRFHAGGQLFLTAGLDKTLRLFQIDGTTNSKIQSIHIPDMPIYSASFTSSGAEIIASGRRKFFYSCDLQAEKISKIPFIRGRREKSLERFVVSPDDKLLTFLGNDGNIILLSNQSKQWVGTLKMNGSVRAAAYSSNGSTLYTIGGDGEVYVWDMNKRCCMHKYTDQGSLSGTSVALSPNGKFCAVGSSSGVVNLYDTVTALQSSDPVPMKSLLNLTTSINNVSFNHDSQIMAMYSSINKDALRLVHIPSFSVFSNWPTSQTPLHYTNCMSFSPHSGFLSIGNDRGKVLLYRLNYYTHS